MLLAASAAAQTVAPPPSIVYVAHDAAAIKHYHVDRALVHQMVNRLVTSATGQPDVARAWRSLVSPQDKVGIKISAEGRDTFSTHREVVDAIADGLAAAGVPRGNIIVWDRDLNHMKSAGFTGRLGYRVAGIAPKDGYDPKTEISAPLLGKLIWGDLDFLSIPAAPLGTDVNASTISHFARILSREVTKVVNVPVMSDNEGLGVAGCIYNMTIQNMDNWRRFTQGTRFGSGSLAEVYASSTVSKKVVLNLMDGLVAEYAGGPQGHPQFQVDHGTLYASRDPVAIDALAMRAIDRWRRSASLVPISGNAVYLDAAAQMGFGQDDPRLIAIRSVTP